MQRIHLQGLGREDVAHFIALTAGDPPPQDLVEMIHRQTEGNPFFVTEVVRLLVQENALASEALHPRRILSFKVPEGVREVIGRRLNRLSPACNQMLSVASVIGREFNLEELRCLIDVMSNDHVLEMVEEALASHLIEEMPEGLGRYQFTHVLIRETLYEELTAPRRARLHRRVGETLETLYQGHLESHLARLAYHFGAATLASNVDKAVEYAERAGARADALLAYEEAAPHYERALQLLEYKKPNDEDRRCTLLLALGETQSKAGEHPRAMETFLRAADAAKNWHRRRL